MRNGGNQGVNAGPGANCNISGPTGASGGGQSHSHNLSANYVGDSASILQPYLVLIYIIKT